jgi:hypothetical protein
MRTNDMPRSLVLLLLPAAVLAAADLYVSPSGSDSNPGTRLLPFKTINQAAGVAQAGTTVHVAPGNYPERVLSANSGTPTAVIRYVSDTRWGAAITPTDMGPGTWTGSYGWRDTGSYVDIEGFYLHPASGGGMTVGIVVTGSASQVRVLNNKLHTIAKKGMGKGGSGGPGRGGIGPGGIVVEGRTSNVDIVGNVVYDVGEAGNQLTHGIYHSSTGNIVNNVTGNNSGYGIHLWHTPHDINIFNNSSFNNGEGGIIVGAGEHPASNARNCIVANNIIYGNRGGGGILELGIVSDNRYVNNLSFDNSHNNALRLKSGAESGTIVGDPKFVNYKADGTGDYHLQPGSPAIDAADPRYTPPTDAEGKPRSGPPDIGAYECGGDGRTG